MASPFTTRTLAFLRALKRHNDRDWFRQHKARYEADVRQPMIALLDRLSGDFQAFAPEFVAEPKVSLYRIYRDTRFSADKTPLKTHVAAHFPMRTLPKGEGGGLYLEIAPTGVWMGGGLYMPSPAQLRAIRAHIAATHPRLHRLVTARPFAAAAGRLDGTQLARVPRGYPPEHPAAHYLRFKQFLAGREFDARFALAPGFYPTLIATFRAVVPMVRFLNEAVQQAPGPTAPSGGRSPEAAVAIPRRPAPMW